MTQNNTNQFKKNQLMKMYLYCLSYSMHYMGKVITFYLPSFFSDTHFESSEKRTSTIEIYQSQPTDVNF